MYVWFFLQLTSNAFQLQDINGDGKRNSAITAKSMLGFEQEHRETKTTNAVIYGRITKSNLRMEEAPCQTEQNMATRIEMLSQIIRVTKQCFMHMVMSETETTASICISEHLNTKWRLTTR
jgi:hypothetical protein